MNAYVEMNHIYDESGNLLGFTAESIKNAINILNNPAYAYSRQKNGYIAIYHKSTLSPTGVENVGGIDNSLEFLIYAFHKAGQLSPVEDLRTAH